MSFRGETIQLTADIKQQQQKSYNNSTFKTWPLRVIHLGRQDS